MKVGIFIGRFQPVHRGHIHIIQKVIEENDVAVVIVGSDRESFGLRNPFTGRERVETIISSLNDLNISTEKIRFATIEDFYYIPNGWIKEVRRTVFNLTSDLTQEKETTLYGHFKDRSSDYLLWFPDWNLTEIGNIDGIDSTAIREAFYRGEIHEELMESSLKAFKKLGPEKIEFLKKDYEFVQGYKKSWESAPFPPTFVTVDCVVVQSGHVLLIKRKINPGKNKFAMPGGFLDQGERLVDGAIRELYEETSIGLSKEVLRSKIAGSNVFDYPWRSDRGRTITHAFYFRLDNSKLLPDVKAGDDAKDVAWMPFDEIDKNREWFFDDHYHIINYFL